MKRIFLLSLIFLAACASPSSPTPASFFAPPEPLNLGLESTSGQIQQAMLQSAGHWVSIQFDGTVAWHSPDGSISQAYQENVWIDPVRARFRSELNGSANSADSFLKISDGSNVYVFNQVTKMVETFTYPDSAKVGQYVPQFQAGVSYPNPIWAQIGTPLSQLAFSSDYAQNTGLFKPTGMDVIAGRNAVVVEWRFAEGSPIVWKMWLDTESAVILKLQEFSKDGSGTLDGERIIANIKFNPQLGDDLFAAPSQNAQPVTTPSTGGTLAVTESANLSNKDAGDLYFFLQPRSQGQSIELVKVSGSCIYDPGTCPPMEKISTPFAFNFTINALSWSPDGKFAAFSYSDQPNGTPTKLWLFDADAKTWKALAEFPYIDPPFWSPDGNFIAFRTQDGLGSEDVYVIRRDGAELKSVSVNLPAEGRPYIMDGWYTENIIMRPAIPGSSGGIYLVRASDSYARPMFDTLLTKAQFIAAPDASVFAYDEYDYNGQKHSLKIMEPDGANAVTLAELTGGSLYPIVWSPDSQWVAFNYYGNISSGGSEVFVINRKGGNLVSIYKGNTVGRLLFSPRGDYLLVEETTSVSGGHLFLIHLATLEQKILQAPGLSADFDWYAPSWKP